MLGPEEVKEIKKAIRIRESILGMKREEVARELERELHVKVENQDKDLIHSLRTISRDIELELKVLREQESGLGVGGP